jgi:hypothetical protein
MLGTFSSNSNLLDKKQHFRIILIQETKGNKDKKYENNPTLEFVKRDFWHTSFSF